MPIKGGGFSRKSEASSDVPNSSMADIAFLLLVFLGNGMAHIEQKRFDLIEMF